MDVCVYYWCYLTLFANDQYRFASLIMHCDHLKFEHGCLWLVSIICANWLFIHCYLSYPLIATFVSVKKREKEELNWFKIGKVGVKSWICIEFFQSESKVDESNYNLDEYILEWFFELTIVTRGKTLDQIYLFECLLKCKSI